MQWLQTEQCLSDTLLHSCSHTPKLEMPSNFPYYVHLYIYTLLMQSHILFKEDLIHYN